MQDRRTTAEPSPSTGTAALWRIVGRLAATGIALFVVGLVLGLALVGRTGGGAVQPWDNTVWHWSLTHRGPLVGLDKVVAVLGDAGALGPICIVAAIIAFLIWRTPRALVPVVAYVGGEALVFLIREVVKRPRPITANHAVAGAVPGVHETSFSFPSGHAVAVTAVFFASLGILAISRRWWWPWVVAFVASAYVADSRLQLGVHWFSDVAIGMALGIVWGVVVVRVLVYVSWRDLGLRGHAFLERRKPSSEPARSQPGSAAPSSGGASQVEPAPLPRAPQ